MVYRLSDYQGVFKISLKEYSFPHHVSHAYIFNILDCNIVKSSPEKIDFKTSDFLFVYLWKGSGELSVNNKTQLLTSGEFVICRPQETKQYLPLLAEQTSFCWIAFNGKSAADLLSELNLTSKEKYFVGQDGELTALLERLVETQAEKQANFNIISSSLFIAALGIMSRLAIHSLPQDHIKGYDKIAPALYSITSDCTSKLGVDDYAKMCNLSTSYFTHLFTRLTGFSPMEYKQLQRIGIAKNLLSTTNLTVKEIANVIGFKDPLYFGRCFKQSTGMTPSSYRSNK